MSSQKSSLPESFVIIQSDFCVASFSHDFYIIFISARSDPKFFIDENSKGLELLSTIFIETDREKWSRAFCVKQGTDQNAKFVVFFIRRI